MVLDSIDRWQGSKGAPVDLGEVRDTLIARCREYRASAVVDPHQAVLIAQEARKAGVQVHEFTFNSMSVGRLALALHQAIRNHRVALPDDELLIDELLIDELIAVRLRKNSLGVYRLDHDSGGPDDQAVTLALGVHWLLEADGSAAMWIEWARKKAQAVEAGRLAAAKEPRQLTAVAGRAGAMQVARRRRSQ